MDMLLKCDGTAFDMPLKQFQFALEIPSLMIDDDEFQYQLMKFE